MNFLPTVLSIARNAGEIIATHFYSHVSHDIQMKDDSSPVTQADIASNHFIVEALKKLDPMLPVLSEESHAPNFNIRSAWPRYWLVDPLDGTKGFIANTPEFCVNIALIEHHVPVLGVIYAPIQKTMTYAIQNKGAWFQKNSDAMPQRLLTKKHDPIHCQLLCGHSKRNEEIKRVLAPHFSTVTLSELNSALKFSEIAQGNADLYVRLGPTSEWDTAAGHCILNEAGGMLVDFDGNPLQYNAKASLLNPVFLAIADKTQLQPYLKMLRKLHEKAD